MKWLKKREQEDQEALETFIKEMQQLGWEKSPDTKEFFAPNYIFFEKDNKRIIITYSEFVSFEPDLTVHGYVLIAITKYLQAVKF